jgi:acylphosphatase
VRKIIVTIHEDASVEVRVEGVSGPGCAQFSHAIEEALGKKVQTEKTTEWKEKVVSHHNLTTTTGGR